MEDRAGNPYLFRRTSPVWGFARLCFSGILTGFRMKVAYVCPSFTRFSRQGATSIDLFVRESLGHSRHRETACVFGPPVEAPFEGLRYEANLAPSRIEKDFARGFIEPLRRFDPDVIEVEQHAPTAGLLAWALPGVPVMLMRHNETPAPTSPVRRAAVRLRYRLLAGIGFCSDWARARFSALYPELGPRCHVLHNGIDTERWKPRGEAKEDLLICAGRMVPDKGILEFTRAVKKVLPRHPGWRAVAVTVRSPDHPAYGDEVAKAAEGLGAQSEFISNVTHDEVMALYQRAQIAVVPSRYEALGRTAIEAHCAGAAVVSSGVGGLREVSGPWAEYRALEPDAIAEGIERLIADPELRARLQKGGRERIVEQFDLKRVAKECDAVHEGLARARGRSRLALALGYVPTVG